MKDMEKRNFHLRIAKPEDAEEIRQLVRNAGMIGQFLQEVEERLAEKE